MQLCSLQKESEMILVLKSASQDTKLRTDKRILRIPRGVRRTSKLMLKHSFFPCKILHLQSRLTHHNTRTVASEAATTKLLFPQRKPHCFDRGGGGEETPYLERLDTLLVVGVVGHRRHQTEGTSMYSQLDLVQVRTTQVTTLK